MVESGGSRHLCGGPPNGPGSGAAREVRAARAVPLFDRAKSGGKTRRYFRGAGHGLGVTHPQDPQRRSRIEKTGKNAWKDYFSIGFSDSPLLIRACPNPRDGKMVGISLLAFLGKGPLMERCGCSRYHHLTGKIVGVSLPAFLGKGPLMERCGCSRYHHLTGKIVGVSLPTFFAKKVGPFPL